MALVELQLSPLPSHVRTARLVVVAAARRAGLEDGYVDELRLAVGEAASRAVALNARHAADVPVRLLVQDDATGLQVSVVDAGPAAGPVPDDLSEGLLSGDEEVADPDVALALLTGLVDAVEIAPGPDGTTVTLRWPLPVPATGPGATAVSSV